MATPPYSPASFSSFSSASTPSASTSAQSSPTHSSYSGSSPSSSRSSPSPSNQAAKVQQLKTWWDNLFPLALNRMLKEEHVKVVFHDAVPILHRCPHEAFAKLADTACELVRESNERYFLLLYKLSNSVIRSHIRYIITLRLVKRTR